MSECLDLARDVMRARAGLEADNAGRAAVDGGLALGTVAYRARPVNACRSTPCHPFLATRKVSGAANERKALEKRAASDVGRFKCIIVPASSSAIDPMSMVDAAAFSAVVIAMMHSDARAPVDPLLLVVSLCLRLWAPSS